MLGHCNAGKAGRGEGGKGWQLGMFVVEHSHGFQGLGLACVLHGFQGLGLACISRV